MGGANPDDPADVDVMDIQLGDEIIPLPSSRVAYVPGGLETVQSIEDAGGEAVSVRCDVTKENQVRAMVDACVEKYGRLDFAFNNAGVGPDGRRIPLYDIVDCPEEVWDQTLDTNLKGVFLCLKYEMRQMIKQGEGGAIGETFPSAASAIRRTWWRRSSGSARRRPRSSPDSRSASTGVLPSGELPAASASRSR